MTAGREPPFPLGPAGDILNTGKALQAEETAADGKGWLTDLLELFGRIAHG